MKDVASAGIFMDTSGNGSLEGVTNRDPEMCHEPNLMPGIGIQRRGYSFYLTDTTR